jgi:cell division septation protein DedD
MLIVGCFQLEENAQNLVLDLKSKGFEASIAGTAPNGLIRVAAGSAVNREQLEETYIKAKQSGLDVWWFNAN